VSSPDVALVTPYPPGGRSDLARTGVASYAAALAHHLVAAGADVRVVAPREADGADGAGGTSLKDAAVPVERAFAAGPTAWPAACRAALATGAPVVHLQHEVFLYGGATSVPGILPGLALLRGSGRAAVVTLHQVVEPSAVDGGFTRMHGVAVPPVLARAGLSTLQQGIRRAASGVIVHEDRFAEVLPDADVVPHGVADAEPEDRRTARARLDLGDELVVLCFGFVAPYKGLEHALDGAHRAGSGVRLVVAGDEHPRADHQGYARELRDRWGEHARFTGHVPEENVGSWFSAADVALLPYPNPHASSGALALALAYRTPVLLSPALGRTVGAPRDATVPLDPDALGARLAALTEDPSRLQPLAEVSRRLAQGRSWATVARRHLDLYGDLTDGSRPARRRVR
jgi:glycosyltransferase involved in cell wall biosynthesis